MWTQVCDWFNTLCDACTKDKLWIKTMTEKSHISGGKNSNILQHFGKNILYLTFFEYWNWKKCTRTKKYLQKVEFSVDEIELWNSGFGRMTTGLFLFLAWP